MLKQGLSQKLLQKLSPQQFQFIQLLQLNTTELENRLDEEIAENPALEVESDDNNQEEDTFDRDSDEKPTDNSDEEFETIDDVDISDYVSGEEYEGFASQYDPDDEQKDIPIASTSSIYDSLTEQLSSMELSDRDQLLANHLIGMIEDDGYLRRPLQSIAYDLAFLNSIKVDEKELERVLKIIQSFEPAGIAARNLQECLMLQIRKKDHNNPSVVLAEKIINGYMKDLANRHYPKMLRQLKVNSEELKEAIDVITHLNPKPGDSQTNVKAQYIIPDFQVKNIDGDLFVTLNSRNAPELKVNRGYQDTLNGYQQSDKKDKKLKQQVQFIKQKLDNAKWFIEAIKQRQQTLMQTMRTIVSYQREFFLSGDINKLRPMILKDVADEIEMDISTVSRVANSKYVQTEFGIFSLKEFFSEGIQTKDGNEVSNKQVKNILKKLIDNESKTKPLTDEKLTEILKDEGYHIARRTVAKYREQMLIPVARLRKELQ